MTIADELKNERIKISTMHLQTPTRLAVESILHLFQEVMTIDEHTRRDMWYKKRNELYNLKDIRWMVV